MKIIFLSLSVVLTSSMLFARKAIYQTVNPADLIVPGEVNAGPINGGVKGNNGEQQQSNPIDSGDSGHEIDCDEEYSHRVFSNWNFIGLDIDLSSRTICDSSFAQEIPNSVIFPDSYKYINFVHCDMKNVDVGLDNILIECDNRKYQVQNDLEDWVIDEFGTPIEPLNKDLFIDLGLSIDPIDIPIEPMKESITNKARTQKNKENEILRLQEEIKRLQENP